MVSEAFPQTCNQVGATLLRRYAISSRMHIWGGFRGGERALLMGGSLCRREEQQGEGRRALLSGRLPCVRAVHPHVTDLYIAM